MCSTYHVDIRLSDVSVYRCTRVTNGALPQLTSTM